MGGGVEIMHAIPRQCLAHTASTLCLSGLFKDLKQRVRRGRLGRKDRVPLLPQLAFLSFPISCEGDQTLLAWGRDEVLRVCSLLRCLVTLGATH